MLRQSLLGAMGIVALARLGAAQSDCVVFVDAASYVIDENSHHIVHADLNRDGSEDFVIGSPGQTVHVLLGNGDGSFSALPTFDFPMIGAVDQNWGLAAGDLNGDGDPDLVICVDNLGTGYLYVALGAGDGTFGVGSTFPTRKTPSDVEIVDLNTDGAPDLVAANHLADGISVLLGAGDGSFAAPVLYPTRNGPHSVTEIDLNGDASPDLVVGNSFSDKFVLFEGVGDGSITETGVLFHDEQRELVVGDLTGDGIDDILTTSWVLGELRLTVYAGTGLGSFAPALSSRETPSMHSTNSALIDFDGDGHLDVSVTSDSQVHTYLGAGDGTFGPVMITEGGDRQRRLVAGDWNGDGRPDLAVVDWVPGRLRILLQVAVGAESYCSTSPNSAGPGALIAATGSFHVEDNDLRLTATGLPPNEPGLFFCGDLGDGVPFEGGTLCVGSTHGLYRIFPARTSSAAGVATIHLDLTLRPFDEEWSTVLPGSSWSFQYWYRDAAAAPGSRINLSDAVRVQFCP